MCTSLFLPLPAGGRPRGVSEPRGPAARCSLPAFVTDVARSKKAVRHAFDDGLGIFAGAVGDKMEDPQTSLVVIAAAVGALLSLAFSDDEGARRPRFDRRADPLGARKEGFMHVRREYPVYAEQDPDTQEWTAKIPGVSFVLPSGRTLEELRRKIEDQLPTLMGRIRTLSAEPLRFPSKCR